MPKTKKSIVFCHGLWADGSCFSKLIVPLQAEGYEAKKDYTVHPDLERAMAKRMGASTYDLDSSHVPMLSQPGFVLDVIRKAANA